jgi:hypothetical protein
MSIGEELVTVEESMERELMKETMGNYDEVRRIQVRPQGEPKEIVELLEVPHARPTLDLGILAERGSRAEVKHC